MVLLQDEEPSFVVFGGAFSDWDAWLLTDGDFSLKVVVCFSGS